MVAALALAAGRAGPAAERGACRVPRARLGPRHGHDGRAGGPLAPGRVAERGARPHRRGRARRWAAHRDRPAVRRDRLGHRPTRHRTVAGGDRIGGALALVVPGGGAGGPLRRPCDAVARRRRHRCCRAVQLRERARPCRPRPVLRAHAGRDGRPGGGVASVGRRLPRRPDRRRASGVQPPRAVLHDARLRRGRC